MSYRFINRREGSGLEMMGEAAENLAQRKVVYWDNVGLWRLADASAVATMPVIGFTVDPILTGNWGRIMLRGLIGQAGWAWTPGAALYASATAGEVTETAPTAPDLIQGVGIAYNSDVIYFDPKGVASIGGASGCPILEGATAYVGFDECYEFYTNYFLCDGTADDIQIQAAMNYVGALGGGVVHIDNGDYNITAALIPNYSGITLWGENMQTTILRAPATTVYNIIERIAGDDIYFFTVRDLHIYHNGEATAGNGIHITANTMDVEITDVRTTACGNGVHIASWGAKLYHVVSEHNVNTGIYVHGSQAHLLHCYAADNDLDGFELGTRNAMTSCYSWGNGRYGIYIPGNNSEVNGGASFGNYLIVAGTKVEVFLNADLIRVHGLSIDGGGASAYGIRLSASANDCSVLNNTITNCTTAGIWAQAGTGNLIKDNLGGTIVDDGIGTKLATKTFPFIAGGDVEGTAVWASFVSATASAKGWSVTGADDWAVTLSQLPLELQQVVRFKIWAVALGAPIGAGGQMHLEIVMNAGADDLAFTTEPVALANFDSVTTDYVNTDVIHWVVDSGDDVDIGSMIGGMSLEVKAIYEAGADPDGATNAVFRAVEVEYV